MSYFLSDTPLGEQITVGQTVGPRTDRQIILVLELGGSGLDRKGHRRNSR